VRNEEPYLDYKKKLIEVALPLKAINAESAREKSIHHGHPSTLHLWWARRPLATARAVIWSSLVDDPSSHPDEFPTEESQTKERERLFGILERLVKWETSNNLELLAEAKAEIMKSTDNNPPALLDPFAGGGSIPLEAQRLGLKAYASDLNPVAVMINKAMIEIPPKFAGQPPISGDSQRRMDNTWLGAQGLAEDVRYYGKWMKEQAFQRVGHLYPDVLGEDEQSHTVIAWLWTRTVKCPNPMCGCEMPLASSFELSKKKGKEAFIQPIIEGKTIRYEVKHGTGAPEPPKTARGAKFKCICCGEATTPEYIKHESSSGHLGSHIMAVVVEDSHGKTYVSPTSSHNNANKIPRPQDVLNQELANDPRNIWCPSYGLDKFNKLYNDRQLVSLFTFSNLISNVQNEVIIDGGTLDYAQAISTYLAFAVDKLVDYSSSICSWNISTECTRSTFTRQAIPMVWDFAEVNPFSNSSGSFGNMLDWVVKCIATLPTGTCAGEASQRDAQSDNCLRDVMISTDPPYYDNISYADLSDFFYVWLRESLKDIYPDLFQTTLVPKAEELVATPYRWGGSKEKAFTFFEDGMSQVFKQINAYARNDVPVTVYYAYKQKEQNGESSGWETMLSAIVQAGFSITGTWPMRTEFSGRMTGVDTNALASSIVLVCRKRSSTASPCTRRDFVNLLKRELKPALQKLQASNIAPVDLAQSIIGPGMSVYSRFSKVLESDGSTLNVRSALEIISQEYYLYFSEQNEELDRFSRFCVELYTQNAFTEIKFGDADSLALGKNLSIEALRNAGVLRAEKGVVKLLTRDELNISSKSIAINGIIWLLTQLLTHTLEKDGIVGVAQIVSTFQTSEPEQAKSLAYRLFQIAESKGWTGDAYAYNVLVISWPDILSKVSDIQSSSSSKQLNF
jgi:putative DNA methylase